MSHGFPRAGAPAAPERSHEKELFLKAVTHLWPPPPRRGRLHEGGGVSRVFLVVVLVARLGEHLLKEFFLRGGNGWAEERGGSPAQGAYHK